MCPHRIQIICGYFPTAVIYFCFYQRKPEVGLHTGSLLCGQHWIMFVQIHSLQLGALSSLLEAVYLPF